MKFQKPTLKFQKPTLKFQKPTLKFQKPTLKFQKPTLSFHPIAKDGEMWHKRPAIIMYKPEDSQLKCGGNYSGEYVFYIIAYMIYCKSKASTLCYIVYVA